MLSVDRVREARPGAELAPVHAADLGLPAYGELVLDEQIALALDIEAWVQSLRRKA
ncbi:hypothetical protein G6O69_37650 [Pseudenhygromyxa sp. WMMC2535]|uniref:hypothetical protein n=1 Tax=Pseudenhygromyxa sp. WMMC2535 TaxID=2712867 RepID=UPI001594FE49|nr:hypothetical protein [Pseudenhygromyxa sp. WMMC2535]NVB43596.1 hypothetical protein [Pseudenhygromyxa sp. WMMC2535]